MTKPTPAPDAVRLVPALDAIAAERRRQIEVEGWTPDHDDQHDIGEMGLAAALYALPYEAEIAGEKLLSQDDFIALDITLTNACNWNLKPERDRRRRMVKAGALIVAEIERLDRASGAAGPAPATARGGDGVWPKGALLKVVRPPVEGEEWSGRDQPPLGAVVVCDGLNPNGNVYLRDYEPDFGWHRSRFVTYEPALASQPQATGGAVERGVIRDFIKRVMMWRIPEKDRASIMGGMAITCHQVDVFEQELHAAIATQPAPSLGGWQDISTAPKDGTWVQAWRKPPSFTGGRWEPLVYVRWDEEDATWVWPDETYEVFSVRGRELADMKIADEEYFADAGFTHWQPLLAAPSIQKGDEG